MEARMSHFKGEETEAQEGKEIIDRPLFCQFPQAGSECSH